MIKAKIIADSKAENGTRLTTFELEYPRYVHSELLTHRMLSRNSASSRAIPLNKMIKHVWNNMAEPIHWGKNQSGMQAKKELSPNRQIWARFVWRFSGKVACCFSWILGKIGCHKQIANRVTEPWSYIKIVTSATSWDNFFHLRCHEDAQPEIRELANKMWDEYSKSEPRSIKMGEWHLPYLEKFEDSYGYYDENEKRINLSLEDAKKISVSLIAQTSFRIQDFSTERAKRIYDRLVTSRPVHASPTEQIATPFEYNITESGNFRGWKQHREEIPGNVCNNYIPHKS